MTSTLNDKLKLRPDQFAGSRIVSSSRTNTNVSTTATSVPVPARIKRITLSARTLADYIVWILPNGTAAPSKATTPGDGSQGGGGMYIDVSNVGGTVSFDIEPTAPYPAMYVAEDTDADNTFDVVYQYQT